MRETTKKKKKKAPSDKAANFLKRIHDAPPATEEGEGETEDQAPKAPQYYQAAAEDDHLGWAIGDGRVDPMYTMRRREQEQSVRGKDAFFKRLKTGGAAKAPEDTQHKGPDEADARSSAEPKGLVAFGGVAFGFGMGGGASMKPGSENPDGSDSAKQKEKKKKKDKEKKNKEKAS
ncbi:hypothetical protein IWW48_002967 [Coemansia sp. RSA 1200]|nr:hypothetical protein IWW48_002967 [Coemansia sp. RSA 1200]